MSSEMQTREAMLLAEARRTAPSRRQTMVKQLPRDSDSGQYLKVSCPDPNCGGSLIPGQNRFGDPIWHCDGLTHRDDTSPLIACGREFPRTLKETDND